MQVFFDTSEPARQHAMAWMFLEDAERVATSPDIEYPQIVLHLERLLSSAAVRLRLACEAHFGSNGLGQAPDQELMWFITAARHVGAHATAAVIQSHTRKIAGKWNKERRSGEIRFEVAAGIDFSAVDLRSERTRDDAMAYLRRHEDDVYLALHSATEVVAEWISAPLDEDFHSLKSTKVGHMVLQAEFLNRSEYERFVDVATNGGEFILGNEKSVRIIQRPDKPAR